LIAYLPGEEKRRIDRFRQPKDRLRSLAANMLTRTMIYRWHSGLKGRLRLLRDDYGKPYVLGESIHFNASHSGDWVVCTIDHQPVGIDIEQMLPIDLTIARRFFSPKEYMDLMNRSIDERLAFFYLLWTLKESYVKAVGKGLSISLKQFTIHVMESSIHMSSLDPQHDRRHHFTTYSIDPNYALSLCSTSKSFPDQVTMIPWDQLQDEFMQAHSSIERQAW
jgi:4'-phosphopantetheinyl transferase